jgi:hypothetical protein
MWAGLLICLDKRVAGEFASGYFGLIEQNALGEEQRYDLQEGLDWPFLGGSQVSNARPGIASRFHSASVLRLLDGTR